MMVLQHLYRPGRHQSSLRNHADRALYLLRESSASRKPKPETRPEGFLTEDRWLALSLFRPIGFPQPLSTARSLRHSGLLLD